MLRIKLRLLAIAILASAQASASDDDLRINGFINVIGGISSTDKVNMNGYGTDASFSNNTSMGLQFAKNINDSTTGTIQLIAKGAESFQTEAAWAYVTYKINDNTQIQMGRFRTPLYYYSEFLDVGYAYNWVMPPETVYAGSGLASTDGINITRGFTFGSSEGAVQAYFGGIDGSTVLGGDEYIINIKNATGLILTLANGNFSSRVSFHLNETSFNVEPDISPDARGLDQFAAYAALSGLQDDFETEDVRVSYTEAALVYDNGTSSAITECSYLNSASAIINNGLRCLVGAAQRLGEVTTIHLTYAGLTHSLESGAVGQLQEGSEQDIRDIILGTRFDYGAGAALKVEALYKQDRIQDETGMLYRVGLSLVF